MRKLSKIDESTWGKILDRGAGETIRKEDDVNLLDRDGLYDYLTSYYKNTNSFEPIYNSDTFDTIKVPFLIQGGCDSVYLSFKENEVSIPYSSPYKVKGLFSKLANEFSLKSDAKTGYTWYIISPKDGSEVTNAFFIDVIDFLIDNIPDSFEKGVKKIITESVWGKILDRGAGETIRKEDDVNHLDFDAFADYIKDNYSESGNWFAVRESEDEKSRHIEIDIIYGKEIDLSFNVVEGKLYNILIQGNKNYVDIPGLKEIFNVNIIGSSTFSVYEKNWTISNNTFVKLIEFFLKKKTNESVWGKILDRGAGETIRKEDDVNLLDVDGLYDYIKSKYEKRLFYLDKDTFGRNNKRNIVVDVVANISLFINYNKSDKFDHILLSWSKVKIGMPFFDKLKERFNVQMPNVNRRTITEKDGTCTNQTYVDVIDFFLDNIDNMLVNESVWGKILDRGAGETIRKEDDINHLDYEEFFVYLTKNYKAKSKKINEEIGGRTSVIDTNIIEIFIPIESIDGKIKTMIIEIDKTDNNIVSIATSPSLFTKYVNLERMLNNKYTFHTYSISSRIYIKSKEKMTNRACVDLIDTFLTVVDNPILEKVS